MAIPKGLMRKTLTNPAFTAYNIHRAVLCAFFAMKERLEGKMLEDVTSAPGRSVGRIQALRAIEAGQAAKVYLAPDADEHFRRGLLQVCAENGLTVDESATMAQLGRACGIDVGAAVVVIHKN